MVEPATSASAAATTKVRRGRMRHLLPASGSLGRRPAQGHTDVRMSPVPRAASRLAGWVRSRPGRARRRRGRRAFAIPAASPSRAASTSVSPRANADGEAAEERVAAPDRVGAADRPAGTSWVAPVARRDDRAVETERDDDGRRRLRRAGCAAAPAADAASVTATPLASPASSALTLTTRRPLGEDGREGRAVRVGEDGDGPRAGRRRSGRSGAKPSGGAPGGRLPDSATAATSPRSSSRSDDRLERVPGRRLDLPRRARRSRSSRRSIDRGPRRMSASRRVERAIRASMPELREPLARSSRRPGRRRSRRR